MKWKEFPQNIRVRLITSFFNRMISMAVMPFMALFFAQELGEVWAGLFLAGTVIISFVINLVGGYVSDRFQRKRVLLISSSLNAFMFLLMTISLLPEQNWIGLFAAAYTAFIITSSLGRPALHAIIIDSTTAENRKAVYAIDYWLVNLSMAIGTAIGGLMYVSHKVELFLLLSITSALLPIAYKIWLKDDRISRLEKQHQNVFYDLLQNYKVAFQDGPFVKVVAGSMFIFAAEFSLNSYIGVRLAETFMPVSAHGIEIGGVRMLSLLNILNMLLVVCLTFWINRFTNRFNKQKILLSGFFLYGLGYIVMMSADAWYVLIAFAVIATLGELIYSPVRNAEQANMMPEDKRGSYSAFSSLSFSGADLIARSMLIIGAYLAPTMMSVYMGILLTLGSALVYMGFFTKKQPSEKTSMTKAYKTSSS